MHTIVSFSSRAALCATLLLCACARDTLPDPGQSVDPDMPREDADGADQGTPRDMVSAPGDVQEDAATDVAVTDITPEPIDARQDEEIAAPDVPAEADAPVQEDVPRVQDLEEDTDPPPEPCRVSSSFHGQLAAVAPSPWLSSSRTDIPDLLAQVPPLVEGEDTAASVEQELEDVLVVATDFRDQPTEFWVTDGEAAIKFFLRSQDVDMGPPFAIRVGMRIKVEVTELTNFRAVATITGVDSGSWERLEGAPDAASIFVKDRSAQAITAADINHLVRTGGSVLEPGVSCGGAFLCYPVDQPSAPPITLRVTEGVVSAGDCVTFVGPVSAFQDQLQLNATNHAWLQATLP